MIFGESFIFLKGIIIYIVIKMINEWLIIIVILDMN